MAKWRFAAEARGTVRMKTYEPGLWSVDDITTGGTINPELKGRSLIRFTHVCKNPPGGLRYALVEDACVKERGSQEDDRPEFSYGFTYYLPRAALKKHVRSVRFGKMKCRIPDIAYSDFPTCFHRRLDIEEDLREEQRSLLSDLHPNLPPATDSSSREVELKGPDGSVVDIHVVNVGQGDTILLVFPENRLWLIDAYFWEDARYQRFKAWLKDAFPNHILEKLIISHFHYDHIRSMISVIEDLVPKEVLFADAPDQPTKTSNCVMAFAAQRNLLREVVGTERHQRGGVELQMISTVTVRTGSRLNPNKRGIVVVGRGTDSVFLLPGDVPGEMLGHLVATNQLFSGVETERFYKVTHHCSQTGLHSTFPGRLRPNRAITSCGVSNRFGHPHDPPDSRLCNHEKTCESQRMSLAWQGR